MTGIPIALTIAGSDSSGGAGIQADLKTFSAFGVYGSLGAHGADRAEHARRDGRRAGGGVASCVAQIDAVLSDLEVDAVKTGMLANAAIVEAVAGRLREAPRCCRWWSTR